MTETTTATNTPGVVFDHATGKWVDPELGDITDVIYEVLLEWHQDRARSLERLQNEVAAALPESHRVMHGIGGEVAMRLHSAVYHAWDLREQILNNAQPGECWRDKGFCRDLVRDNESLRVRTRPTPHRVSFAGGYQERDGVWMPSHVSNVRERVLL